VVTSLSRADAPGWVAARLNGRTGTRWIGVDGLGAAGKTTLAEQISTALPGSVVVSVDDFGRAGLSGWDIDLFTRQVVRPLLVGRAGRYQRWDLLADVGLEWVEVPVGVPVVVEGVSCTDVRAPVPWDVTLWVSVPVDIRRARIAERDGAELADRWRDDWWPSEQRYVAEQHPEQRVDAVVEEDRWPEPSAVG
jgi:cytidylate kinase